MHEDGALACVAHILQDRQKVIEIVTVDGADIVEAQLFEQGAAGRHAARIFFSATGALFDAFGKEFGDFFGEVADRAIGAAGNEAREIGRHATDGRRNRHIIVVQHDDQTAVHRACVVHGFVGHARAHRAVTDDGDDIVFAALQIAADGHAEARGNGRGRMGRAEGIVFALGAFGEAREATSHAQRADAVATVGENFMRVSLMADIPDETIFRCVEHIMKRDGEFDDAETGTEMAAGDGHCVDGFGAQFIRHLTKIALGQAAQIRRVRDAVEEWCMRFIAQNWNLGTCR